MSDKIERARAKLLDFKKGRGPDRLPIVGMQPRSMPGRIDMKAKHTATLPNPLIASWPSRLTDALYAWCWDQYHKSGHPLPSELVRQLEDPELDAMLTALDGFKLSDLAPEGVALYEALIDDVDRRRHAIRLPRARVAIEDAEIVEDEAVIAERFRLGSPTRLP
jgi:hypothetical protein